MHAVITGTVNNSPAKKIKAVKKNNPQSILHAGSLPDVMGVIGHQQVEDNDFNMNMNSEDKIAGKYLTINFTSYNLVCVWQKVMKPAILKA